LIKTAIYDPQFLSSVGVKAVLQSRNEPFDVKLLDVTQQLAQQIEKNSPDLLVLEYLGENPVQVEVLQEIKQRFKKLKVLIISNDDDTIEIKRRIALGVEGFLTKTCSLHEIQLAVDTIIRGGRFYCQKILGIMTNQEEALSVELTPREEQIVRMISKGTASSHIAEKLNLSIHTINSHRKNIIKKLGFKSPTELIAYAVKKMS
jgi:two-component system response regulator NreC